MFLMVLAYGIIYILLSLSAGGLGIWFISSIHYTRGTGINSSSSADKWITSDGIANCLAFIMDLSTSALIQLLFRY